MIGVIVLLLIMNQTEFRLRPKEMDSFQDDIEFHRQE